MQKEAGNTSSFTSFSISMSKPQTNNKDFKILVLKNKINSYYCQRLIWALISILILSSQDTAAHVSSPQEPTTAAYQYIIHNMIQHKKASSGWGFSACYADPHSSNLQSLKYLLLTLPFKSKAKAPISHAFTQRCCTNTEALMIISAN